MRHLIESEKLIAQIKGIIAAITVKNNPNEFGTEVECMAAAEIEALNLVLETIKELQQEPEIPKIKGWVARDKGGRIFFGQEKPHKLEGARQGVGFWTGYGEFMELSSYMFPDLKWEDEPRKCELNIRLL